MTGKLSVKVESFKPRRANSLCGFADLLIVELRLKIKEVPILQSHGRRWAALPAKPQLNSHGCVVTDERRRRQYVNLLQWSDRKTSDAFSERLIAELLAAHPHAFDHSESGA